MSLWITYRNLKRKKKERLLHENLHFSNLWNRKEFPQRNKKIVLGSQCYNYRIRKVDYRTTSKGTQLLINEFINIYLVLSRHQASCHPRLSQTTHFLLLTFSPPTASSPTFHGNSPQSRLSPNYGASCPAVICSRMAHCLPGSMCLKPESLSSPDLIHFLYFTFDSNFRATNS